MLVLGLFLPLDGKGPIVALFARHDLVRDSAGALQKDIGPEMRVQGR